MALIQIQDVGGVTNFISSQELFFFLSLLNKTDHGWDWVSVGSPLGLQSFLDFHPKLKQELTLTLDKMLWLKGPLIYFPQSSAYLFLNRTLVTKP